MLKQSRKVGVSGSFQNQIMGNNSTIPRVGEGATILLHSDRNAYEVISVSKDNLFCTIRSMDVKFIGEGYGDEKYTYHTNEQNHAINLEWDTERKCWFKVHYVVDIIKSLFDRLYKQYDSEWANFLPNNVKYKDLISGESTNTFPNLKLVKGITKSYKVKNKVSIIFGIMQEYRDPHL